MFFSKAKQIKVKLLLEHLFC